jgi:radical SAM protein with 4Fe4S-binding SPASM domain
MIVSSTEKAGAAFIPEVAYSWRPFANPEMIYKNVEEKGQSFVFIIDPWTQRWIIAQEPVIAFLRSCDGCTRLSEIIRTLSNDQTLPFTKGGFAALAEELANNGLIFANKVEHQRNGQEVYNSCEPVGLHLEITNACNMTCSHCYVASGKKLPFEMSFNEVLKVIDALPPFSGKRIALSGGEPVVRKDCAEILEYCVINRGHDVDLYTNGKRFPPGLVKRILELNQRRLGQIRIQVSLEGASAATNDLVRGEGSFEATLKTLLMFKELGISRSVVLFVCITRHNVHEIDLLINLAESFDIAMLVFSQWQKQGNASDTPWASLAPSTEEWVAIGEKLLKYNNPRLQVFGNFYGDLNNNACGRLSLDGPLFPKHLYYYNAFPRITPEGMIFADQLWVDPSWILGNARKNSLDDVFDSPKFFDQLSQMRSRSEGIASCRACEWRRLCESGSPGHTYAEYGHMNERDLFCESRIYWFNRFVQHQTLKALAS